jgi:ribonuclease Y
MSLFTNLSRVFKPKSASSGQQTVKPAKPKQKHTKGKVELKSRPIQPTISPETSANNEALVREAQAKAKEIILEAKDEALRIREDADKKASQLQSKYDQMRDEMSRKAHELDRKDAVLVEKERFISRLEQENQQSKIEVEKLKQRLVEKLEDIAGFTREEAREQIVKAVEKKATRDIALRYKDAENKLRDEVDEKAKDILVEAMQHGANEYVAEFTVSTVELPSEDIKGRLIGKEGRNIRAFERATGVDLDLDDTPGTVRLSSFDSVRREVARQALKRLIADGRIQPSRIEEYVEKARKDTEKVMFEEGKKLCHAVGAYNVPREIMAYLGRFKFRSSYGQNMISHTLEETKIGIALANEVGANVDTVRMGCLLHDIGKVVTDEEGSHVELGVKLLKKYNLPQPVIDAVAQHHEDEPFSSNESILVYIADAISGARPGARYENYDEYVKRMENLEKIGKEYRGIKDAYAIQAGRELRVIANHEELTDDEAIIAAEKIRDRIKNELTYPGTVTVNVIREVRATAVAK